MAIITKEFIATEENPVIDEQIELYLKNRGAKGGITYIGSSYKPILLFYKESSKTGFILGGSFLLQFIDKGKDDDIKVKTFVYDERTNRVDDDMNDFVEQFQEIQILDVHYGTILIPYKQDNVIHYKVGSTAALVYKEGGR